MTQAGTGDVHVTYTGKAEADIVALFAIPAQTPGVPVAGDGHRLGLRGNASNPMTFDDEVSEGYRIGAAGGGFDILLDL